MKIRKPRKQWNVRLTTKLFAFLPLSSMTLAAGVVIDESVTIARKSPQRLQDSALSVSIITADELNRNSILSVDDLSREAPNLFYTKGILDDQIQLRGMGTNGGNQGFEPAVSLVVDNLYLGKNRYLREGLFDLERAEIIYGPQSLYYGRNTSAGVVSLTTAKPTDTFYASISASHNFDLDGYRQELIVSGPLSENLGGRLALQHLDEDGWLDNTDSSVSSISPQRDSLIARGSLVWTGDSGEISAKLTRSEFETTGTTAMPVACALDIQFLLFFNASTENCQLNNNRSGGGTIPGGYGKLSEESEDFESTTAVLSSSWDMGGYQLETTTGYTEFETNFGIDADFTDVPILFTERPEQFDQFSQEIRLRSNSDGPGGWILGLHWETSDYTAFGNSDWGFTNIPRVPPIPIDASTHRVSTQKEESTAIFGEWTLEASENLMISLGGRYTHSQKEATHVFDLGSIGDPFDNNPIVAFIFSDPVLFGWTETDIATERTSHNFSPSVSTSYRWSDNLFFYASYSEGFKAGGFDLGLDSQPVPGMVPDDFEFDDETVKSFEVGGNAQLLNGDLNLRFAVYRNEYSDLQTLNFDGIASFVVSNAASAESQGIELISNWRLMDRLVLNSSVALGNHEYTSYPNGPCTIIQQVTTPPPCSQNLKGAPLPRAPERQANLELVWNQPIGNSVLEISLNGRYTGDVQFETDNDPFTRQSSFWKYDAFVSLTSEQSGWVVRLAGKNLADKTTITSITDLPLSSGGSFFATVDAPRTVELTLQYQFAP